MRRPAVVVAVALAACTRSTPEEAPVAAVASAVPVAPLGCGEIFSAPKDAEPLCDEHVMGTGMEIHWRSYGSKQARAAVEPPYRSGAGPCGYGLVTKPPIFSVTHEGKHLELFEAGAKGYPTCSASPKPEHKTLIVISEKFDRR